MISDSKTPHFDYVYEGQRNGAAETRNLVKILEFHEICGILLEFHFFLKNRTWRIQHLIVC